MAEGSAEPVPTSKIAGNFLGWVFEHYAAAQNIAQLSESGVRAPRMPNPVGSRAVDQFRLRPEAEPLPRKKPDAKQEQAPVLPKAVQLLVDQNRKASRAAKPVSDASAIARELSRQAGIEARAEAPKPKLQPMPAGARPPAAATPAQPDCYLQGAKASGTCGTAVLVTGAGVATGPADLVALGIGGFMCGNELLDYYRCLQVIKP